MVVGLEVGVLLRLVEVLMVVVNDDDDDDDG